MGSLIPLFWTSGDVSSGFQSRSGQPYLHSVETYMLHVSILVQIIIVPFFSQNEEIFNYFDEFNRMIQQCVKFHYSFNI